MKRKTYQAKDKMFAPTLTHMREVAFGKEAQLHVHKTLDRSERMRNDEEMLRLAEEKRLRKAMKRKQP